MSGKREARAEAELPQPLTQPPPQAQAQQGGERVVWEYHTVTLTRVPGYGFGIAVSGGRDNPHFANGDPAIAISDVLKAGPAEGKLQVNDRILSANGVSLENVDYATAVQVLRDSGPTVTLVVKRRVVLPITPEPQTFRITLSKSKKKEDFGIILGCKLYVKEVTNRSLMEKDGSIQEGDLLLKINNYSTETMTMKEAKKMIENSREKLHLLIRRDPFTRVGDRYQNHLGYEPLNYVKENHSPLSNIEMSDLRPNYTTQNLYVQPPTRSDYRNHSAEPVEDKNNLARLSGRSRGPIVDVSLSQLDRPATPVLYGHSYSRSRLEDADKPPPRPPPPRAEDYYNSRRQLYEDDPLVQRSRHPVPDPRFISFQKEGSVGIRLTGGNEVGIFVTAVQPGSPASLQGLQPGDKILKVNDMDMKGVTREEAVLFLLSLQDQIDLIVQYRKDEYDQIVATQKGDSFYIKTHFNYDQPNKGEMSFRKGDVFHVVDTLHNGVVGSWQVFRIGRNNQEVQKGIVPNKSRAEELATAQFNAAKKELSAPESRGSFFRRRKGSHRRSKSLGRDHWDDVVFSDSISKFPAYERVVLKHPGFIRPVVLYGPVADLARQKLLRDFPDKFASPQLSGNLEDVARSQKSGIIRLSVIKEIVERGKHMILDIAPNAVDRLNYAQFYPIVIFLRAESKHIIKELRSGLPKSAHKSSKKLYEQCEKLDKLWNHIFTSTVTLTSPDTWYKKIRDIIEKEQSKPLWVSELKPDESLSDDFLFPMTSRFSYASSPESDLDLSPDSNSPFRNPLPSMERRLVKSSSDPSIATQEENAPGVPNYNVPPPYSVSMYKQEYEQRNCAADHRPQALDSKYGFSSYPSQESSDYPHPSPLPGSPNAHSPHSPLSPTTPTSPISPYLLIPSKGTEVYSHRSPLAHSPIGSQEMPPELPPKVDRSIKPGRIKTAQERLFGGKGEDGTGVAVADGNYINAAVRGDMVDRQVMNAGGYDSASSYDSYNRLGPNAHDDLKSRTLQVVASPGPSASHDPYRFTRSTAQPVPQPGVDKGKLTDLVSKYRHATYKPVPPPKTVNYKPVPPPKPKNYRAPQAQMQKSPPFNNYWKYSAKESSPYHEASSQLGPDAKAVGERPEAVPSDYFHAKSFSVGESAEGKNGRVTAEDEKGGFDSGHGSSLDRNREGYNNHSHARRVQQSPKRNQCYYNVPPPRDHPVHKHEPSGLDLVNREQRGSAFELYKKPADPRPTPHHCYERTVRGHGESDESKHKVVATAIGVFDHNGGKLENDETGVAIIVPPGAIRNGVKQEIYFKVCQDTSMLPPLDKEKGEMLLSPLVMCGPHGLKFQVPVELQLPHCASVNPKSWSFALKSSDTPTGYPASWQNVTLADGKMGEPNAVGYHSVSVLVDHF